MRHYILVIIMLLFTTAFSYGQNKINRKQFKQLMNSSVVLPNKVTGVSESCLLNMSDSLRTKPQLLIYLDSTECMTCRFSNIWVYNRLAESLSSRNIEVIILLANIELDGIPISQYLSGLILPMTLYVDDENMFLEDNPILKHDKRMHSLLLNESGRPLFVGDPFASRALSQAFDKVIQQSF